MSISSKPSMSRGSGRAILIAGLALVVMCAGSWMASNPAVSRGLLLVVNKGDQTLSIVDPESGRQLAAVPLGGVTGHEVAASPDGRTAWVPIYGNSGVGQPGTDGHTLSIIDLKSRTRIASMDLGVPARPHSAIFGPNDGKLYVTAELTRTIKIIDPITHGVIDSIPTGAPESHMLAISQDGTRAYTANVSPERFPPLISGRRRW